MRSRDDALRRWLPPVAWAALTSFFSSSLFTGERTGAIIIPLLRWLFPSASRAQLLFAHEIIRKLAHFAEYLVLGVLLYRALRTESRPPLRAAATAVVLAALWAASDELHQAFVPGRTPAVRDVMIDVSCAIAGQGVVAAWPALRAEN